MATALLFALPFMFVRIPPLTDVPGHIGRFAVAAAPVDPVIARYFGFHWRLILNLGADLLVEAGRHAIGLFGATWLVAAAVPAITAAGLLAVARQLNPRGAYGLGWALIFVYNYCFLWGFLNYALAAGLALCGFALWIALQERPGWRAALFLAIPSILLVVHGVGGVILLLLIVSWEGWRAGLQHRAGWRRSTLSMLAGRLWPLAGVAVAIGAWRVMGPPGGGQTLWILRRKTEAILWTVRDQSLPLDVATVASAGLVFVLGRHWGARLRGGSAGPVLALLLLFVAVPSLVSGSDRIDTRLPPLIAMLALALQDWSAVAARRRRIIAIAGATLLAVRLCIVTGSFIAYDRSYAGELAALDHVRPGTRVLNLTEIDCHAWRTHRLEHLPNLATPLRHAWVNAHWAIGGLQLLDVRYRPSNAYYADPSHLIWPAGCVDLGQPPAKRDRHTLAESMRQIPLDKVDYLWLIATRLPRAHRDARLALVWSNGNSELYAVRH